jgi:hypothetical protein
MSIKKKLFMIKKLLYDLRSSPPDIYIDKEERLGYYYLKFQQNPQKLNRLISQFDENGIPLNKAYIDVENPKLHYYPISIGQYGLSIFHKYLESQSRENKEHFLRIADWFISNANIDQNLGAYWLTDVDKPEFKVFQPWKSAFTQSRAISILTRAWQITGKDHFKIMAIKALRPYQFSIYDNGVKSGEKDDIIYEEYVAEKPTRILDGSIFSLFGLYDALRVFKNKDAPAYELSKDLFEDGINGLIHWLPKYDMGYWVYYNRCEIEGYPKHDPCTIGYLRLVTAQLEILYKLTRKDIFLKYVNLFRSYDKPINILKMYTEKYKALKILNRL